MVNIQTIENRFFCILYTVILSISYTKKNSYKYRGKAELRATCDDTQYSKKNNRKN